MGRAMKAALCAASLLTSSWAMDAPAQTQPSAVSVSPADTAWQRYRAELAREHSAILTLDETRDPQ